MIGMDCDRPRGEFINSIEGTSMAERKINSIEKISSQLDKLELPRTFSICGSFLESMSLKFGEERMSNAFRVKDDNVEIADHSYSHNIVKPIKNRQDKIPLTSNQVIEEYNKNTNNFVKIMQDLNKMGNIDMIIVNLTKESMKFIPNYDLDYLSNT